MYARPKRRSVSSDGADTLVRGVSILRRCPDSAPIEIHDDVKRRSDAERRED